MCQERRSLADGNRRDAHTEPMATIEDELEQSRRPDFLSSALQTYAAQVAVAVLSLGNALLVARALGPTGRGCRLAGARSGVNYSGHWDPGSGVRRSLASDEKRSGDHQ